MFLVLNIGKLYTLVGFKGLTVVITKSTIIWDATLYSPVKLSDVSEKRTACFMLFLVWPILRPYEDGSMFLRYVSELLLDHTSLHPNI
jgi:hypothetical protein